MADYHAPGRRKRFDQFATSPPEQYLSVTEQELAAWKVYLTPEQAEELAELEKTRRVAWLLNQARGEMGQGKYER